MFRRIATAVLGLCVPLAAVWLTTLGTPSTAPGKPEPLVGENAAGWYCGAYSMYSALRTLQLPVRFDDLAQAKYIGSTSGSTAAELRQAALDHGAMASIEDGLTVAALRASSDPIILHVRKPGPKSAYNHWVLFLGCDGDFARVIDPPNGMEPVPLAELLAVWDGTGIVVSRASESSWSLYAASWFDSLLSTVVVLGGLLGVGIAFRHRRRLIWGMFVLVCVSIFASIGWHFVRPDGFLRNPIAVGSVIERHSLMDLREIDFDALEPQLTDPNLVVVDARLANDYAGGHVTGAISIPISSGWRERRKLIAAIPVGKRVIVYCQSDGCRWGDEIAAGLFGQGFTNITVFRGGYREWERRNRTP